MKPKNVLFLLGLGILLCSCLGTSSVKAEELNLDFSLVNSTGWGIKELYIAPSASDDWGTNILKDVLKDGGTLKITFSPKATAAKWDISIVWEVGGKSVVWKGYKLTDISKITLKYDEATKETTATTE